jgi:hypothetical protein
LLIYRLTTSYWRRAIRAALTGSLAAFAFTSNLQAHGIAGNRLFAGTLSFDDPAVADEAILPLYSYLDYPTQGSNVSENRINAAFSRLLTPTLSLTIDSGWVHQNWPIGNTSGVDKTNVGLKYEAYRDNRHEALISVGLAWGIGHSGASAVGTAAPNTIQPGVFVGKGFGDLPESLSWLRPFAVTGAIVDEVPVGSSRATALAPNLTTGRFDSASFPGVEILRWGFSVQFSTLYLTDRFDSGPPIHEPINQWVPLIEFKFDSPSGQKTVATANPGFTYIDRTWQLAAEIILPMNHAGGNGLGFRAQLLLFLDDLLPSVFGKPLLTNKAPRGREIAW